MFNHILVPLDGSSLAEAALPVAATMAQTLNVPITLLHIIEQDASPEIHRDRHLTNVAEAETYLAQVAQLTFFPGIDVERHVHSAAIKDVASSIVDHSANEYHPNLIILTSHGNSGMRDLFFGTIAQDVAAASGTPVLLVKPRPAVTPFHLRRILVPLDNESIHDQVLPFAKEMVTAFRAQLDLLCVIPTLATLSGEQAAVSNLLPTTAAAYLDIAEEIAVEHFQAHLDDFQNMGIVSTAEIARGDPASVIAKTAEKNNADLILFGTHGRAGFDAFWNRSVAASVARKTDIPSLLIPLQD